MHAVHQHEPQHVHLAEVPHLLRRHEELDRLVQVCVGRPLDALHERLGRLLERGDDLREGVRCLRHLAEFDAAVQGLLARLLFRYERPRELLRGLAFAVRLEVALGRRIGLEHLRRGGDLPLERPQELLLLCHVLLLIISSAGFLLPARACQGRRSILPRAYLQWVIRQHGGVLRYDSPLPHPGGAVRIDALVLVSEAVARLRLAHARERELARQDALTGGPNARAFYEVAGAEIARARRYIHPFSVAYLDLDDFKLVNDRLGHLAGDAVLRSVARALSGVLRSSDVVARLGGDEFVVLLPEAGAAPARLATEKLRGALADVVPAHGWRMTASIGVATFLVPPESVDQLLAAVDRLMYRAKQGGKNGVVHETRNEAAERRANVP